MRDILPQVGERYLCIREDYLKLTGDFHSAVLLAIFKYWTEYKLGMLEQLEEENKAREFEGLPLIETDDLWIWRTQAQLIEDSLGILTPKTLKKAIKRLQELGYLEIRKNPRYKWDRTNQYRLNLERVREDLKKIAQTLMTHEQSLRDYSNSPNGNLQRDPEGLIEETRGEEAIQNKHKNNKEKKYVSYDTGSNEPVPENNISPNGETKKRSKKKSRKSEDDPLVLSLTKLSAGLFYRLLKEELGITYRDYGKLMKVAKKWAEYGKYLIEKEGWEKERFIFLTIFAIIYQLEIRPSPDPVFLFGKPAETHATLRKVAKEKKSLYEKLKAKAEAYFENFENQEVSYGERN